MFTERATTTTTTTTNDYNYTPRRGFRASVRHHPGVGVFGARHAPSRPDSGACLSRNTRFGHVGTKAPHLVMKWSVY